MPRRATDSGLRQPRFVSDCACSLGRGDCSGTRPDHRPAPSDGVCHDDSEQEFGVFVFALVRATHRISRQGRHWHLKVRTRKVLSGSWDIRTRPECRGYCECTIVGMRTVMCALYVCALRYALQTDWCVRLATSAPGIIASDCRTHGGSRFSLLKSAVAFLVPVYRSFSNNVDQ